MEFPINSQEEFDAAVAETYGNVADLQSQIQTLTGERDTHAATIADLQGQIKGFELKDLKRTIAQKKGIPESMASRLTGETEDEINADADALAEIFKEKKVTAPKFEPSEGGDNTNLLSETLSALRGD